MSGWSRAFALSKDEIDEAKPPGTVELVEHNEKLSSDAEGLSPGEHIVRYPVPTSDPADPLNWPTWRKFTLLLIASIYAFVANWNSAVIASGLPLWPLAFPTDQRTLTELSYLIAVNILFIGVANAAWVPLSNIFGKRPVLIAATLVNTLCTLWCALAKNYNSLLAARIFQGIGGAAADTVAPALIGDVFFMDQRGRAMAIYTVFLAGGPLVGGISGGYIAFYLGWAYLFWISLALSAATFLGTVLFVPETSFNRIGVEAQATSQYRPYTFLRSLEIGKPTGGVVSKFIQPWKTLVLPGTWVVMLHYGGLVGGIVTISTIGPQLLAMPPYLWGENVGLLNLGGLVGCILGAIYTYMAADWYLKRKAKRRTKGFAEPEDRLPLTFPALFISTAGFLVFGFCAQNPSPNAWLGLEFGYGMITFGLMQVPSVGFNYLIDAYTNLAADCFVMVTTLRAIVAFAWTFFVAEWITQKGAAEPFGIFGMLMGIFSLLTVPLWLFGKRIRVATASSLS
ncbi:major facilitator superfamily transporter [Thozetella sp. PMI_491]|nr:major facilitator superfamily transporter [Thozetella sp. PMI_491]